MKQFIKTTGEWISIIAVICIMVLGVRLMYQLSNRTCVETTPFSVGNETLGMKGSHCKTWKQN